MTNAKAKKGVRVMPIPKGTSPVRTPNPNSKAITKTIGTNTQVRVMAMLLTALAAVAVVVKYCMRRAVFAAIPPALVSEDVANAGQQFRALEASAANGPPSTVS